MSRSYQKTPITGNTKAKSEKQFKSFCNRAERRINKVLLEVYSDEAYEKFKKFKSEYGPKDGKQYFDKTKHEKCLRK